MWLDIKLFKVPRNGSRRYDLLVQRGKKVQRVPGCYYHLGAQQWFCIYADRGRHDRAALRAKDVPIYFMAEPDYPPHLDLHRKK